MKPDYGLTLKPRSGPVKPVPMALDGPEGSRIVLSAARRVMATHEKAIKGLAKR